jgi:hypothetical protein
MAAAGARRVNAGPAPFLRRVRRALVVRAGLLVVLASATGCSMVVGAARMYYDASPEGSERREWGLRRTLARGAFDTALVHVSSRDDAAPRDRLLRSLYDGLVAYYAGEYERSGHSLRSADELAEDRYTKSISRGALSLVSSDLALPYMPGQTERLLVHYYAALSYLRRDDVPGAAVEVRRLSQLLEQFDERRDPADRSTRALLRYFAGTVFEAAGDRNDADVAYRNARELAAPAPLPIVKRGSPLSGEVVVLLERGFVAQRVEESMHIEVGGPERDSLTTGSDSGGAAKGAWAIGRMLRQLENAPDGGVYRTDGRWLRREERELDDEGDYLLKVAWPVYLRPVRQRAAASLVLSAPDSARVSAPESTPGTNGKAATPQASFTLSGDISDAIIADYRRQRLLLLTRTVARAAVKYAATEAAEKKKGEAGKAIVSLAGSVLEHADTRSWHLLPADVALTRLTLPVGRHRLAIRIEAEGDSTRTVDLGEVDVTAGGIAFVSTRLWPDARAIASVSGR